MEEIFLLVLFVLGGCFFLALVVGHWEEYKREKEVRKRNERSRNKVSPSFWEKIPGEEVSGIPTTAVGGMGGTGTSAPGPKTPEKGVLK